MPRAKDVVVWTEDGRTRLARDHSWGVFHHGTDDDESLRRLVTGGAERLRPAWLRGLTWSEPSDAEGHAAVAFTSDALAAGALPGDATVEQAAGAASLLGGHGDVMGPLVEQLVRRRGARFALAVLVRMWQQETRSFQPRSTHSEDDLVIRLRAVAPDDPERNVSVSSRGKERFACYLLRSYRAGDAAFRAEMIATVEGLWPVAPSQALAPLAIAVSDPVRATDAAHRLLADKGVGIGFAAAHLPFLLDDPRLIRRLMTHTYVGPDLRLVENLGARALPIYDAYLGEKDGSSELLVHLHNLRGPRTARIVARFAERAPYSIIVHNYFADSPELLIQLRGDETLDQERLARLERKLRISHRT